MDTREASLRPDPYDSVMPVPGKKRRSWLGIILVALLVLVVVLLLTHKPKPQPAANLLVENQTVTVRAGTVRQGDIGIYVNALGTVTPLSTVSIYSQVTGKVVAVNYREGQMVRKGQSLIEIDSRPYEAQLKQAQGTLQHDQSLLKQAEIDLARYQKAVSLNAIAKQTLDDQEQAVEQYKGTVKNDEGQVEYQQVQLSYCHLTAPASGRVGLRLVDPGNTIFSGSGNALVVVTQLQPITVVFNVAEDNLSQLRSQILRRSALPVDAFDRALLNKVATGHLLTIDNQVDTTTGTIRFRAEFDNHDLALYPNQFVNARLLVSTLHNALLIPSAAVQRNGVQAFVYKVNSNQTTSVQNIVEKTTDGTTSAVEGLNAGDVVSTTGFDKLEDGTKVEIEAPAEVAGTDPLNPSRTFVLRPVATALLMVAILVIGLASYTTLPVSALPEADYPTIQVQTFYPGASPQVMSSAVTAPLERQFGQVAGLSQMTSTSSDGSSVIVLQFALNLNIDVAEQEVQAAINAAQGYLPTDLPVPPVYSKSNPADAPVLTLALTSNTMPLSRVEDLVDTRLAPKISQLSGVGLVTISGGQKPAVRIQANPVALASYGVNLEDLRNALTAQSVNSAKGSFDGPSQSFQINANDQLLSSAGYRDLVVAYKNGAPVMLTDVARISDDIENTKLAAWMNETPAVILNIQRQPGANTIQVVRSIELLLPKLQATLPVSVKLTVLTDRTNTIRASVRDVEFELMLTIALVVMVIFLFLRNLSATIIPSVAVPLSLVGTFAVMQAFGYSLNNLTLMAFTISTGFVVDDAIVMIENISRYLEEGLSPMEASLKGAQQIGFTIISLTISLIAVLIPLLFMGDIVGRLFREFAVTLSITILISAFVSLTLTPMMAARILRYTPEAEQGRFYHYTEGLFKRVIAAYGRSLRWVFRFELPMLLIAFAMLVLTVVLYIEIPKGFFPTQDTGIIQGISQAPESISFAAMARKQQQLAHEILKDPAVQSLSSFIGADGVNTTLNSGRIQINLKAPEVRGLTASQVIARLSRNLKSVPGIKLFMQPVQDLTVDDRASRTEYQYTLEDPDPAELAKWTGKLVAELSKLPELRDVATDNQPNGVTAQLSIDRATASRMNITADTIDSTLYDAFGQRQISTLYTQSNQYHVILEAMPEFQKNPRKLDDLYVQGSANSASSAAATSTSGRNTSAASSVTTLTPSSTANASSTQATALSSSSSSNSSSLNAQGNTVSSTSSSASPTGSNLSTGTPTNAFSSSAASGSSSSASQTSGQGSAGGAAPTGTLPTPVPLSAFTHFEMKPSPLTVSHQGQFPVVTVSFNVGEGYSLGQAVDAVERAQTKLNMPASVIVGFQGTAAAYTAIGGNEALLIMAALLAVYIVLGVLYESFVHPITILSTLPSAGVGALLALRLFGQSLDIIAVIGIILLIGIVKKNGIMIVDFALEAEREQGKSSVEAIYEASLLRFRPILMTTLAALFAGIPLAVGSGIGSELRRPLGIAMVGGLLVSQVLTLYTTPIIYIFFDRIAARLSRRPQRGIAGGVGGGAGA